MVSLALVVVFAERGFKKTRNLKGVKKEKDIRPTYSHIALVFALLMGGGCAAKSGMPRHASLH
jgi:hypothetical protein